MRLGKKLREGEKDIWIDGKEFKQVPLKGEDEIPSYKHQPKIKKKINDSADLAFNPHTKKGGEGMHIDVTAGGKRVNKIERSEMAMTIALRVNDTKPVEVPIPKGRETMIEIIGALRPAPTAISSQREEDCVRICVQGAVAGCSLQLGFIPESRIDDIYYTGLD